MISGTDYVWGTGKVGKKCEGKYTQFKVLSYNNS